MVCLRHCVQTLFWKWISDKSCAVLWQQDLERLKVLYRQAVERVCGLILELSWSLIWILRIWLKPYDPQTTEQGPVNKDIQRPLNRSTLGPLGCNLTRSSLRDFRTSPLNITQAQTRCHPSHLSHLKCQTLIWDTQTAHTARHFASEISQ